MNGRLWTDIAESESSVIFVDDIRRDFLSDDLVKKSLLVSLASLEEYKEIKIGNVPFALHQQAWQDQPRWTF